MTTVSQEQDPIIESFLGHCHRKSYSAKQLIIKEGDSSNDLYYIINGSVTVMIEDSKGHKIVMAYLNAGDFFGELGLFNKEHKRTAFIRAKSKSNIARISYDKLKALHDLFPKLLFSIASQMSIRLHNTSQKASDLAFTDVKGRVARALLDLCKEPDAMTQPDGMQIKITRQELGRIVGCSREMVGRVLKNLEEDRLISLSGKTIVIFGAC